VLYTAYRAVIEGDVTEMLADLAAKRMLLS